MTLLVTGFSSFPGAPRNPTEAIALKLDGVPLASGGTIRAMVLPVEWDGSWPKLRAAIEAQRPRAVLLFGLHAASERIRIELVARNARELGRVDAAGGFPSGPAVTDGPERLEARLPLAAIAAALRAAGAPFECSRDAGRYLCNDSFYRLALAADRLGVERFGFIHVPLTDDLVEPGVAGEALPEHFCTLPAETLTTAALAIANAVAAEQAAAAAA